MGMLMNAKNVSLIREKGSFPTTALIRSATSGKMEEFTLGSPTPVLPNTRLPRMRGYDSRFVFVRGFGVAWFVRQQPRPRGEG